MCTCTSNNHPYIHRNLQMLLFHLILELAFITETNFLLRFSTHAFLVWPIQYVFNESIKFSSRPLVIWLLSLKQKTTFVLNYKKSVCGMPSTNVASFELFICFLVEIQDNETKRFTQSTVFFDLHFDTSSILICICSWDKIIRRMTQLQKWFQSKNTKLESFAKFNSTIKN